MKASVVGVFPRGERERRQRLFGALETAFDLEMPGRDIGQWNGLNGAILFGEDRTAISQAAASGIPLLVILGNGDAESRDPPHRVQFSVTTSLDARLRGRSLQETSATLPIPAEDGDDVLAETSRDPAWILRRTEGQRVHFTSSPPEELTQVQCLRDRLKQGRFLSLLPVVHFLREVCPEGAWSPPPLRATFLLDDPNLHWPKYGFLDFHKLASEAEHHNYHVSMAMIPLDGWFAHPSAVRCFRDAGRLSLLMHGNNHLSSELARVMSDRAGLANLAQGLRRVERFEHRTGIEISRVMAAPHGACSERAAGWMLRLGYEGMCITRPYPWLSRPPAERPLAGWGPAELVAGGFPIVPRDPLGGSAESMVLRAFLNHPLILYGHHYDLAAGLTVLAEASAMTNTLGDVTWMPLNQIMRSNFATRREGHTLFVRLYSRRVRVKVPTGVTQLIPEIVHHGSPLDESRVACRDMHSGDVFTSSSEESQPIPVSGARELEIAFTPVDSVDAGMIPAPAWRPWPIIRRALTEGRDRALPLFRRLTPRRS